MNTVHAIIFLLLFSRYGRSVQEESTVTQKPRFLGPLKGTNKIVEGQRAHFEVRVEPQNDMTLQVSEMLFNPKYAHVCLLCLLGKWQIYLFSLPFLVPMLSTLMLYVL
jgi:hypothetical protein